MTTNASAIAREQHDKIGINQTMPVAEFHRTEHPDAQWFPDAGLGLFIHWGISSVRGEGDLSWSMMAREAGHRRKTLEQYGPQAVQVTLPPDEYWKQAPLFQPDQYDPLKWLQAAKRAGFRYAVLTTRHHDGFALWPSAHGNFNTKLYQNGRDYVGEFVKACRACELKVGFYYSPPDWYFERQRMSFRYGQTKPFYNSKHEPYEPEGLPLGAPCSESNLEQQQYDASYRSYMRGQVEALLTRYGTIDLLWFDGPLHGAISIEEIRRLQPGIVMNPRGHGCGDFETYECRFPQEQPQGWWEYCHLWADGGWGYLTHEIYKPTGWVVSELARARAWAGNFLINVAPRPNGELPEMAYRRFEELRSWMSHSGESIFDIDKESHPMESNAMMTRKGSVWYAHLNMAWDEGRLLLKHPSDPVHVRFLRTSTSLVWNRCNDIIQIEIPSVLRTAGSDVIRIDFQDSRQSPVTSETH